MKRKERLKSSLNWARELYVDGLSIPIYRPKMRVLSAGGWDNENYYSDLRKKITQEEFMRKITASKVEICK